MGRNLSIGCACGALTRTFLRGFEYDVLKDCLELRARLRLPEPPIPWGPTGQDTIVPAARFASWFGTLYGRLRNNREHLPHLYELWEQRSPTGRATTSAYCTAGAQGLRVATDDLRELVVLPLAPEPFREHLRLYRPSAVPDAGEHWPPPTLQAARYTRGAWVVDPAWFRRVFAGTAYHLEHGDVLWFYRRPLGELRELARHARRCGLPLSMWFS